MVTGTSIGALVGAAYVSDHLDELANSINIMQARITRSRMAGEPADVTLTLRLGNMGVLDFDKADQAIEEGVNCVRRMAPVLRHTLGIQA